MVKNRSLDTQLLWKHWLGFIIWVTITLLVNQRTKVRFSEGDVFLFPITSFLSGLGILTIFRLVPSFGFKQSIWYTIIGILFIYFANKQIDLNYLKKYKYIWLLAGLSITALTIFFGVNPMGGGPRLWLGCCGFYFQPSEPLKFLFIVYLSAYFADQLPLKVSFISLIIPSLIISAIALLILIVQQDLGTALIFIFIYTTLLFIATGKKLVLLFFVVIASLSSVLGYYLFDVVRIRIDSWVNPWLDPSGRSYQIVQSLMSISNGGLIGRGPGGGYPNLVPVAISDFIYTSIAEELGIVGTLAIILLLGIVIYLGVRISLGTSNKFHQFLSMGITGYLVSQSILIIGGNLRLLPLTGVTLPFLSYGGSSLLTSFLALFVLLIISSQSDPQIHVKINPKPYLFMGNILMAGLLAVSLANGWWSIWRGPELLTRSDNARRSISDIYVKRGAILSRNDQPINITTGTSGNYKREYIYPDLSPIAGYTNNIFGQAGLEASLDGYLRGLSGQNSGSIIVDNILYGQPPPGLNVRTSINLNQQSLADDLLGDHKGAVVLLNSETGEILVMASHPNFDPNKLDETGSSLATEKTNPLLNRAAQGIYPTGDIISIFLIPDDVTDTNDDTYISNLWNNLGFLKAPEIRLPTTSSQVNNGNLFISPLQLALATASLSNDGLRPAPRIAIGVENPNIGWVILPALDSPVKVYEPGKTKAISDQFQTPKQPFWEYSTVISDRDPANSITWFIGGTLYDWKGTPLTVTVLLEESNISLAKKIGELLLQSTMLP